MKKTIIFKLAEEGRVLANIPYFGKGETDFKEFLIMNEFYGGLFLRDEEDREIIIPESILKKCVIVIV